MADEPVEEDVDPSEEIEEYCLLAASEPTVDAPLDPDEELDPKVILRIFRSHVGAIRSCFCESFRREPHLWPPAFQIAYTIGAEGKVVQGSIGAKEQARNPQAAGCVVHEMHTWVFPPPAHGGSVKVSYPNHVDPA